MKKIYLYTFLILAALVGCQESDDVPTQPFVASFEKLSVSFASITDATEVTLVFSEAATYDGEVVIEYTGNNIEYGADFETVPVMVNQQLIVPFNAGDTTTSFTFQSFLYPYEEADENKAVNFQISAINYNQVTAIQGYTSTRISFDGSLGTTITPQVGGPNQGNQVFVDLSTELTTVAQRDTWDLGFYGGEDFRVTINGSVYMAAAKLEATNIDEVTAASVSELQEQVAVGTFDIENENYIDDPSGVVSETAIDAIAENDAENHVYLVNLGYEVGEETPAAGSVAVTGEERGYMKIRILRDGDNYRLQYADVTSNTHNEVTIYKDDAYNFTFFSLENETTVFVEPKKDEWDLCFTVFTNIIEGSGSYGYSDFVLNNLKAGVQAYEVDANEIAFTDFVLSDISEPSFLEDQRVIGADWRDVFSGDVFADKFYVLKDTAGNYYKIRMLAFLNESGERGYPQFEYKLIQE